MRTVNAVIGKHLCNRLCSRGFRGRIKNKRSKRGGKAITRKMGEEKKAPASKPYVFASLVSVSGS